MRDGKLVLLLSDRYLVKGKVPIHALLATGAVHHRLVKTGLRCKCNILVETGTARDAHHFACLLGYGATAVYPYIAYQTLFDLMRKGSISDSDARQELGRSYRRGIRKGLFKIMSKMGISTIASYRSAQLFEIVGLRSEVVSLCFEGSDSRIEGADFADLKADADYLAERAWDPTEGVSQGGLLKFMHGGEYHMYNPDVIATLQSAVMSGDYEQYREYAALVNGRPVSCIRDLLKLNSGRPPIPLEEVESETAILTRFDSAGMSLGALSPEAHEALAIAMNRLGARSNSGEGGEDPARYGTEKNSKIKQVASGRFGVTPEYLINAEVLQIKIAQGAKPGEGGQLPGHKVNEMIARLRFARPGVGLISPPPHHDIYSIEDLAQLIFDLKQINPQALVSVKLVAEPGVGTVAAGVAKAYADLITVSGYDGGTGASPLSSIKYAGTPWELGLAETHQTLRSNELRHRVRLQTDGGLKTGLDVIKAAIIGAESFGFGTAPMVALGCKYLRICHLNNCATGVATQHNILRAKYFIGLPEMVMNYFRFVARECREIMASIGVRSIAELIGSTQFLEILPGETSKQRKLDLTPLLANSALQSAEPQYCTDSRNAPFDKGVLGEQMALDMRRAIETQSGGEFAYAVSNFHRSIGARVSGEIAKRWGNAGMSSAPLDRQSQGLRRPELRRVECGRPASPPRRGGERLRRQGHGRRQDRAEAACGLELRGARDGDHGKHLPVRGHRGRAVCRRNRRRALRRAQLRRARGGRGHGRSLLRVHDRRRRLRAGAHGREFRCRIHRRLRVRARHGARFRRPLQPRVDRHPPRVARGHGHSRAASARIDRAARRGHRQRLGHASF